ncbi:MAG: GNAT family N-acetyltransferase [Pirellulaceae bacterium]
MHWSTVSMHDVDVRTLCGWRRLLAETVDYVSPYFTPEYVQSASEYWPNVEIGTLSDDRQVWAVFPFERLASGAAGPVGRELADYQGPICHPQAELDAIAMLRALRLKRWSFDHLYPHRETLQRWCWTQWASPQIDVSGGPAEFLARISMAHKRLVQNSAQNERRLKREFGSVKFDFDVRQPEYLELLLDWKCQQYEATGRIHPFRLEQVRHFLHSCLQRESEAFCGRVSMVSAHDQPIAMQFSFDTSRVSHVLITAYHVEAARFSPGLLLSFQHLKACAERKMGLVDLGKGLED